MALKLFVTARQGESGQSLKTGVECLDSQMEFLMVLKQVFNEGQNCAPPPECDRTIIQGNLTAMEQTLNRKQTAMKDLTARRSSII